MKGYAGVVVDLPVKAVDRPFDYKIPDKLQGKISIGSHVLVPFGGRKLEGFVIELKDRPEIGEVKEIARLLHDYPLFDAKMLELMLWIADYYQSVLITVIKTAIPNGVVGNKVETKTERIVRLNVGVDEGWKLVEHLSAKRAIKQAQVIEYLLAHPEAQLTSTALSREVETVSSTVAALEAKGLLFYHEVAVARDPYAATHYAPAKPFRPNFHQHLAIEEITRAMREGQGTTILLKGVTGSGKTEVYLQSIAEALTIGKDAIVLVPEIALTPQTVERFKSRFGDNVAVLHSQLSLGERYDEWQRIYRGAVKIVVGARSAIFAPFQNLGLIIIDEEHETSYKQSDQLKYHARDVAIQRAKLSGAVTVLGSATPAVESFYKSVIGEYKLVALPERVNMRPLPPVAVVDMRMELKKGNRTIFSKKLDEAIEERLAAKKQVILFLNRRGFANFVLCRECGYVIRCKHCDVSLTYHAETQMLQCHYCDYSEEPPKICPGCGSHLIKYFGIGTEQVEQFARERYPKARIVRMDVDTTRRKGAHDKILQAFRNKEIDILIGTQMIAKGHDFPEVTLVGVVLADIALHFPDFRSGERTFQLLTQVAGRTGRGQEPGEVIVQTYSPEHYAIKAAEHHDYDIFFHEEIGYRKEILQPPLSQLINIVLSDESEELVIAEAHRLANLLNQGIYEVAGIEILGPAQAPLAKVRGKFRWQIILKSREGEVLRRICREIMTKYYQEQKSTVTVTVDVDPLGML